MFHSLCQTVTAMHLTTCTCNTKYRLQFQRGHCGCKSIKGLNPVPFVFTTENESKRGGDLPLRIQFFLWIQKMRVNNKSRCLAFFSDTTCNQCLRKQKRVLTKKKQTEGKFKGRRSPIITFIVQVLSRE